MSTVAKRPARYEFVERAERYVDAVLAGKIPACKWIVLACKRHREDRKRARARSFPYIFDEEAASAVCEFAEMLPHVKGEWAERRELIVLRDWQCFILCSLFGWRSRKTGLRRFREAYLQIPRKNGKSVLAAIIGLYMWSMDGEAGAEVYSGATTEKQAWEVFRPAKLMLERTPELMAELGIKYAPARSLTIPEDLSRFEPVIGKPGDGSSPSCAIADEFHEHATSDLVDTMKTGMLARRQPLLLQITTAGNNLAGPCYDKYASATKVLEGVLDNEQLFIVIYTIDETDDWADPRALPKANPNFGVSVSAEDLAADQRQAVLNPADQNRFRTKHLNVWCAAKIAWMPIVQWDLCGDEQLSLDEFMGQPCIGILDLASKDDIAAFVLLFEKTLNGIKHIYSFEKYYLPEETILATGPNSTHYRKWHHQNLITVTDGAEIDFDRIGEDVLDAKNKFQFRELVYDPWRATQLAHQMQKSGATIVEVRQTVQNISAPMKEMLSAVKGCRFHHTGNPVTKWMVSNVVAKADAKDNIYPRKEKAHMKIDGAVAIIMGVSRVLAGGAGGSFSDWLANPIIVERKQ